jgi:hypothetical protein
VGQACLNALSTRLLLWEKLIKAHCRGNEEDLIKRLTNWNRLLDQEKLAKI